MRREFALTEAQLEKLLDAGKPTGPVMYISGGTPMFRTPQENANYVWQELARELGFVWDSVQPVSGKHHRFFSAEVSIKENP